MNSSTKSLRVVFIYVTNKTILTVCQVKKCLQSLSFWNLVWLKVNVIYCRTWWHFLKFKCVHITPFKICSSPLIQLYRDLSGGKELILSLIKRFSPVLYRLDLVSQLRKRNIESSYLLRRRFLNSLNYCI